MTSLRALEEGRRFGFGIGGLALCVGLLCLSRDIADGMCIVAFAGGGGLVATGWFAPRFLVGAARRWSRFADVVSLVGNGLLLGLVFLIVVTPIGLVLRLAGKDLLDVRGPSRATYWRPYSQRQADRRHYERMA